MLISFLNHNPSIGQVSGKQVWEGGVRVDCVRESSEHKI